MDKRENMSFWRYLSPSEKTKYILLGLIGAVIGIGVVVLAIMGMIKGYIALLIVSSTAVPLLSQGIKIRNTALERMPPEELSDKDKKILEQSKKLVESAKWSKKELKIVLIVFIFCILFAILCWLYLFLRFPEVLKIIRPSQTTPTPPPISESKVTLTTDKTEYEVGDSVVIRVKNGLGKEICFGACSNCPSCHAYNLERKEGDGVHEIVKRWGCGDEMNVVGERLGPGESTEFTTYYVNQNPQKTSRYRVAVLLSFDCSRISFEPARTAYSNEFTIKKLDLPLVLEKVNFYTYPSGEIVFGDGEDTGETLVKRDLDGDGKEEEIYVDIVRFSEGIDFVLHIDGKSQRTDFRTTDFSVVDIDGSDSYQEVVLHNPGPSNDDVSLFFWYNGREIKEMGKLARWPRILGNGEVLVADWMGFWAKTDTYVLDKETRLLEWVRKETYEVGIKTKSLETIRLYEEKSYDSKIVKEIEQGEEVEILLAEGCDTYFCEWFQLEAGGIKGWAKQDDFEYRLELTHAD